MKKVILSVINDLSTDQRLDRVCKTLLKLGYDVELVGRKKRTSLPLEKRAYKTKRMTLLFEKGPIFYAEYNFRLFLLLLFRKSDLFVSNDLDTLLPNFMVSRIRKKSLVHDSHEYYTETPELINRKKIQRIWKNLERYIFPKLKYVYTVNESIANLYRTEYDINIEVIRNVPFTRIMEPVKTKKELGIPENKKIILLQGAGINIQRGAEEMVEAMQYIDNAVFIIVGDGDVLSKLKQLVKTLNLSKKVIFIPKQPLNKVLEYTLHADLGVTLDKDTNINYKFSLPNKLFDYIQAQIPILASPLIEIKAIIDKYQIGETIENHDPNHISDKINLIFKDQSKLDLWKENLKFASRELCWENEEQKLIKIYKSIV